MSRASISNIGRLLVVAAIPAVLSMASAASVLAADLGQNCENPDAGYTVAFPSDWWANEAQEGATEGLEGYAACVFFAEEPAEVPANAGLPPTVAIDIGIAPASEQAPGAGATIIDEHADEVDGRPAMVRELEMSDDAAPFFSAGDRVYQYLIDMGSGEILVASTTSIRNGDYASHQATLDAMMDSLDFAGGARLPDTAIGTDGPMSPAVGIGLLFIGGAMAAGSRRPAPTLG
ncbi:MAG: hypothetical protein ACRDGD_09925 [Candidatus Limnocylindria bacterium]